MSDKIEASDILGDDATPKLKEFNNTVQEIADTLRELQAIMKSLNMKTFVDSKSINDFNKETIKAIENANRLDAAMLKADKQAQAFAANEFKKAQAAEKSARQQEKLNSEYEKTKQRYDALSKAQIELSIRGRENGKVFKSIQEEAKNLRAALDKAEQGAGRFQRNVGNYKSGFDGLQNSINQLTREFPAFTNSFQTGFMAISNNLPTFFDEIKKANTEIKTLREQGEQVPGLFSRLTSSMFSWGTALSAGVTLLTVYGKEIGNFIVDLFKQDKALEFSKEGWKNYYSSLEKSYYKHRDAILDLAVARKEMTQADADIIKKERELNKERLEDNSNMLNELIEKSKETGVDLLQIWDSTNQKIKLLNESQSVDPLKFKGSSQSLAAAVDLDNKRIAQAKKINAFLIDLQNKYATKQKEDVAANEAEIAAIRQKAWDELLKDKEKEEKQKDRQYEKDNEKLIEMRSWQAKYEAEQAEKAAKLLEKANKEHFEWETKQADIERDLRDKEAQEEKDAFKKSVENLKEEKQKAAEEDRKRMMQELNTAIDFSERIATAKNNAQQQQLNNELAMRQRNIEQQQQLAMNGQANTLAFEKAQAAKAEKEQQDLAKKQQKQQEAIAYAKAYLSALNAQMALSAKDPDKNPPEQAAVKALGDVFLAKALATVVDGFKYEGTESVKRDLKGNKVHNGRDGYILAVDGEERILNGKQNAMLGDISNNELVNIVSDYKEGILPKYITAIDSSSFAENTTNSMLLHQFVKLNSEIKDIKKELRERPVHQINIDNLGNVIDTKIVNGFRKITRNKGGSPLNYV